MALKIKIETVKQADIKAVEQLYREAGWWEDDYSAEDFIPGVLSKSFCFAGAFLPDGTMIGMGRAIADTVSDAYIQDVTVLKQYRKNGIGSMLIRHIIEHLQQHGIDWIGLIGEPGTKKFYERLGFSEMTGFIPMKLKNPQ